MTHQQIAASLRRVADWIETNTHLPAPEPPQITIWGLNTKEEAAKLASALGTCDKKYQGGLFYLEKDFDGSKVVGIFLRDAVCQRVVVGTKEIPEQVIPASPELVIPARTEEIVQWECGGSLLEPERQEA